MTAAVASRREDLTLELHGLVLARALLELRGYSDEQIAEHESRIRSIHAQLERLGR
jgi:hypothetical protein